MDQCTNYLDALSQPIYSEHDNVFLSPPPSSSSSPVSSEASDSFIDEATLYGLYGYDISPTVSYNPYDQNSINIYDAQMAFNGDAPPSFAVYQPSTGYATQEPNPGTFDYAVHLDTVTNLTSMFADSAPFGTVEPSATSAPFGTIEPSATSAPFGTVDPSTTSAPSTMGGRRRTGAASYRASTADSDYSPSGESEVEDDNDHSYGEPQNRKKSRSVRVSHVAHPYLRPAPKPKSNKRRGTKLEIPVPVPGLTKNSRGRDVPRKTEDGFVDRPFWCRVEGCNKLFSRGEHLKRHIISIHTEARPYVCECSNDFNRRDNLFQHMRAKGCAIWYKDGVRQCKTKDDAASIKADNKDRACKQARPRS